jgi:two-component system sensor kinase FixL
MDRIIEYVLCEGKPGGRPWTRRFWPALALSAAYVALFLFLDRVSFIRALHGIDITPWNPPPGLSLTLLLVKGLGYAPAVVLAELLSSQLLPLVYIPPLVGLASGLIIAAGYGGTAILLRYVLRVDIRLRRARDVVLLIMSAIAVAGIVSIGLVATYAAAGIIRWMDAAEAGFQLWIGDAIGAVVLTPLLLVARDSLLSGLTAPRGTFWLDALETIAQLVSIAASLVLVFGFNHDRYSFQLFYLLFLPVVWIATRRGLGGASWAVLAVQIGLIAALDFQDKSAETIRTFQLLMFAVATTGLLLGAAVSERHRVSRALAESQGRLAAILNTARDGVLTIDSSGRIESINPAVEQLFGRPAQSLIGGSVDDLLEARHSLERLTSTARLPLAGSARQELDARRADGSKFPIELTVGQFGDPGDEHYTLVIRDISSRRQAEASVRAHQSELAHVSRLSLAGEMGSALAHELNQPLTAIAAYARGCLRLLRQPTTEPPLMKEGVEQIVAQAERAGDIISRLREFVSAGTTKRSVVAVEALVGGAVALAQIEAAQNGVDIDVRIAPDLPPVLADRIQIEQVLLNLLRNGMEAILSSDVMTRVLTIEARRTSSHAIEITVVDTGPGVAEDLTGRLFEPFVTTKPLGMGLGLSISRSIIEAHDGRLRFIRREGAGAVFTFDLPVYEAIHAQETRRHGG